MILTKEVVDEINHTIENVNVSEEYSLHEFEMTVGLITLFITFSVWGHYVEDIFAHTEVPYPNVEDLSYYEFSSAEITDICAYDDDGEEVVIENKNDLKY